MSDRTGLVTFGGNPVTISGNEVKVGDKAPNFQAVNNDLSGYDFYKDKDSNKVYIISAVPSIDTGVCDKETRKFNEEAAKLGNDIEILTISEDLPFAQGRWCGAAGIDKVKTISDYNGHSFATNYGVMIKEFSLLARCVFVIDKSGVIKFIEMVNEVTNEPDYSKIIEEAKKLV